MTFERGKGLSWCKKSKTSSIFFEILFKKWSFFFWQLIAPAKKTWNTVMDKELEHQMPVEHLDQAVEPERIVEVRSINKRGCF